MYFICCIFFVFSDEASTPDLTKDQVIIIGSVCAAILTVLLIILVCIIWRRYKRNKSKFEISSHSILEISHYNLLLYDISLPQCNNLMWWPVLEKGHLNPCLFIPVGYCSVRLARQFLYGIKGDYYGPTFHTRTQFTFIPTCVSCHFCCICFTLQKYFWSHMTSSVLVHLEVHRYQT